MYLASQKETHSADLTSTKPHNTLSNKGPLGRLVLVLVLMDSKSISHTVTKMSTCISNVSSVVANDSEVRGEFIT